LLARVVKFRPNYSVVMSVSTQSVWSRVAVQKNNSQGRLTWEGKSPTHISIVQVSEPGTLQKGDSMVTVAGSISAMFPPDIMVGILKVLARTRVLIITHLMFVSLQIQFAAICVRGKRVVT
jgi:cell shape-determining protein MreC